MARLYTIPEQGDTVSYEGREFAEYEIEAWREYHAILDDYDDKCNVKMYDRVSVHEAFPEILEAFNHCLAMRTYRLLKDGE